MKLPQNNAALSYKDDSVMYSEEQVEDLLIKRRSLWKKVTEANTEKAYKQLIRKHRKDPDLYELLRVKNSHTSLVQCFRMEPTTFYKFCRLQDACDFEVRELFNNFIHMTYSKVMSDTFDGSNEELPPKKKQRRKVN